MHSFYENCENERYDCIVLSGPDIVGFVVYTVTVGQDFLRVLSLSPVSVLPASVLHNDDGADKVM